MQKVPVEKEKKNKKQKIYLVHDVVKANSESIVANLSFQAATSDSFSSNDSISFWKERCLHRGKINSVEEKIDYFSIEITHSSSVPTLLLSQAPS